MENNLQFGYKDSEPSTFNNREYMNMSGMTYSTNKLVIKIDCNI